MALKPEPFFSIEPHSVSYFPASQQKWNVDVFLAEFQTIVTSINSETIEFDLVNCDCTFANALRRVLVAEVPSFAIDRVYMLQNTSVIADEIFCHRLGLVPLNIDCSKLEFCNSEMPESDDLNGFDPNRHVLFDLSVKISPPPTVKESGDEVHEKPSSYPLYSKSLIWTPLPGQGDIFNGDDIPNPAPVSETILLNKLSIGDEIEARCLAVKGIGRDHAKFSPVSAAFYKLLPHITLKSTVRGDLAKKLQNSFAKGVIHVDPKTLVASVANARLDNGSREHLRLPELSNIVSVHLNPRHFLFTVESIAPGFRPPDSLVKMAIDVLLLKCAHYLAIVERPAFASVPVTEVGVENASDTLQKDETSKTKLNGRLVGLDASFVSTDLRRATFRFTGEDHTIGAALRFCILQSEGVKLCGYCQPHPLEDAICFEIQSKNEPAVVVLRNGLYCLRACFEQMKRKFKSAVRKCTKSSIKLANE